MEATETIRFIPQIRRRSLTETIADLRVEFDNIKNELRSAYSEKDRLMGDLAKWRARYRTLPEMDLGKMRRRLAFYCHPDRGGDAALMSNVNQLFDLLVFIEGAKTNGPNENGKGAQS